MLRIHSGLLIWLRHAGVPLGRPGLLLVVLAGLLLTIVVYLTLMLLDDTLMQAVAEHMTESDMTPEELRMVRVGLVWQSIFLGSLMLVGWFGLAKGWRFARLIWWLLLGFVALSDLWRIVLSAIPLIVNLILATPLSEVPSEQWIAVRQHLLVWAALFMLSVSLFLPPISRWYKALRQRVNAKR